VFHQKISRTAYAKSKIWKELKSEQPNILNLNKLASIITKKKDEVTKLYVTLSKLSENNIKTLEIYGAYLIDIENNLKEASKIYDRLLYTVRDKKKKSKTMKLESENMAIVLMSSMYKERGKVIGVNTEATRLFRYSRSEMVNHPIENFMPNFYAKHHKDFMSRFLRHGTSRILGYKRRVFILNKSNFIQGAILYVKVMASLDDGVHVVGFLSSNDLNNDGT
jgi:PAS domain S-box-containing protein